MISLKKKMLLAGGKRTLFATNFGEYTVGTQPSDWTKRWETTGYTALVQSVADSISGKALRLTKTADSKKFLSWDKVPGSTDVEFLYRFRRTENASGGDSVVGALARATNVTGTATGANGFGAEVIANAANSALHNTRSIRFLNGVFSFGGSGSTTSSLTASSWWWVRISIIGTTVNSKLWVSGSTEPVSWTAWTNSDVTGSGLAGLQVSRAANPNCEVDYFAVDIAAKSIPLPI